MSRFNPKEWDMRAGSSIVICGGGIAGVALAIQLRKEGLDPLILERQKGILPQVKGEFFQPQGVLALRKLELLEPLLEAGAVKVRTVSHTYKNPFTLNNTRFQCRYDNTDGIDFGISILHEDIVRVFRQEYVRLGGRIQEGIYIKDVRPMDTRCELDLSDGSQLTVDYFFGADGRHSSTRKKAGLKVIESPCERVMLAALLSGISVPKDEFYTEECDLGVLYAFQSNVGQTRVYTCVSRKTYEENKLRLKELFMSVVQESALPKKNRAKLEGLVSVMPSLDILMEKNYLGRALWLGDAAGAVDPLCGHGMSVALVDAIRIGKTLGDLIREHASVEKIASAFETIQAEWRTNYLHARFIGRWIGILFMGKSRWTPWAKWRAIRAYEKDDELKSYLMGLFGGTNKQAFGVYDLPYLLGLLPSRLRKPLERMPLNQSILELQSHILTTPFPVLKERALSLPSKILNRVVPLLGG